MLIDLSLYDQFSLCNSVCVFEWQPTDSSVIEFVRLFTVGHDESIEKDSMFGSLFFSTTPTIALVQENRSTDRQIFTCLLRQIFTDDYFYVYLQN